MFLALSPRTLLPTPKRSEAAKQTPPHCKCFFSVVIGDTFSEASGVSQRPEVVGVHFTRTQIPGSLHFKLEIQR